MPEYLKTFKRRALLVYALVLVFGIACLVQVLILATKQRALFSGDPKYCLDKTDPNWKQNPLAKDKNCRCIVTVNDIFPARGDILDDQGNVLASDFTVFDVTIDGTRLHPFIQKKKKDTFLNDTLYVTPSRKISRSNKKEVTQLIEELSEAFYNHFNHKFTDYSKEHYRKKIAESILECKNVDILQSNLSSESLLVTCKDTAFLYTLPLFQKTCPKKCTNFTRHYKRIYPQGELAKRTVGAVTKNQRYGVEHAFDHWLSGKKGAQKMLFIDSIPVPSEKFSNPEDGANVHTTLNLKMQSIVYEALMDKLFQMDAQWGCAIVMEIETGEIKAMANLRKNVNKKGHVGYFEDFNYTTTGSEPGSTFKLASLLAYLEKVPNDTAQSYLLCGCSIAKYFDKAYSAKMKTKCNATSHRAATPMEIFQRSSNEGIGSMIFGAYNVDFKSYLSVLDSMGITLPLETQFGTVNAPKINRNSKDNYDFYATTWGNFKMTPIQTLTYFNGVVNHGKMVAPKIVSYISKQDKVLQIFPKKVIKEQMARKDVIARAQKYLEAVVNGPYGTARLYKDSIPHFAGKTGTRGVYVETEKGWEYDKTRNGISFCGYFPVEKPKYSMIVYIYDVQGKSPHAVQLFYTIAKRIENPDLMKEIDKSKGVITTLYQNLEKK